jgi:Ca2+-binding RTX toxin-like protein
VTGEQGQDRLSGGPGNDSLIGGPGDDLLLGDEGNDVLNDCIDHNRFDGGPGTNNCQGDSRASTFVNCAVITACP